MSIREVMDFPNYDKIFRGGKMAKKKRRKSVFKCERCGEESKDGIGWWQYGKSKYGKKYNLQGIACWCFTCGLKEEKQ